MSPWRTVVAATVWAVFMVAVAAAFLYVLADAATAASFRQDGVRMSCHATRYSPTKVRPVCWLTANLNEPRTVRVWWEGCRHVPWSVEALACEQGERERTVRLAKGRNELGLRLSATMLEAAPARMTDAGPAGYSLRPAATDVALVGIVGSGLLVVRP